MLAESDAACIPPQRDSEKLLNPDHGKAVVPEPATQTRTSVITALAALQK